jgi:hypothetical protein
VGLERAISSARAQYYKPHSQFSLKIDSRYVTTRRSRFVVHYLIAAKFVEALRAEQLKVSSLNRTPITAVPQAWHVF